MAAALDRALAHLIANCPFVTAAHDLLTKWRIELEGGYLLDLYFNETKGKYSYSLIRNDVRIIGWDNAPHHPSLSNFPHHPSLSNFPHHFHTLDGSVQASELTGDPEVDLEIVRVVIERLLQSGVE